MRQARHQAAVGLADTGHHQRAEYQHRNAQARRHQRGHTGLALRHAEVHEVLRHRHNQGTASGKCQQRNHERRVGPRTPQQGGNREGNGTGAAKGNADRQRGQQHQQWRQADGLGATPHQSPRRGCCKQHRQYQHAGRKLFAEPGEPGGTQGLLEPRCGHDRCHAGRHHAAAAQAANTLSTPCGVRMRRCSRGKRDSNCQRVTTTPRLHRLNHRAGTQALPHSRSAPTMASQTRLKPVSVAWRG